AEQGQRSDEPRAEEASRTPSGAVEGANAAARLTAGATVRFEVALDRLWLAANELRERAHVVVGVHSRDAARGGRSVFEARGRSLGRSLRGPSDLEVSRRPLPGDERRRRTDLRVRSGLTEHAVAEEVVRVRSLTPADEQASLAEAHAEVARRIRALEVGSQAQRRRGRGLRAVDEQEEDTEWPLYPGLADVAAGGGGVRRLGWRAPCSRIAAAAPLAARARVRARARARGERRYREDVSHPERHEMARLIG